MPTMSGKKNVNPKSKVPFEYANDIMISKTVGRGKV